MRHSNPSYFGSAGILQILSAAGVGFLRKDAPDHVTIGCAATEETCRNGRSG